MLTKDEIGKILVEACSTGADFAELYFEDTTVSNVRIIQDKVDESSATNLYGCGLRVLKDMEEAYGYTNDTSFDGLWQLAQNLKQNYHSKPLISAVSFQEQQRTDHTTFGSLAVDYDQLCATLKQIAKTILAYDSRMIQAAATYQGQLQKSRSAIPTAFLPTTPVLSSGSPHRLFPKTKTACNPVLIPMAVILILRL